MLSRHRPSYQPTTMTTLMLPPVFYFSGLIQDNIAQIRSVKIDN